MTRKVWRNARGTISMTEGEEGCNLQPRCLECALPKCWLEMNRKERDQALEFLGMAPEKPAPVPESRAERRMRRDEEAVRLVIQEGLTLGMAGKRLGITVRQVRYALKRLRDLIPPGMEEIPGQDRYRRDEDLVSEMELRCLSSEQAAREFGITRKRVRAMVERVGRRRARDGEIRGGD